MAQQTINIGAAPDDNTGDTAREGGDKINDNFTELYAGNIIDHGTLSGLGDDDHTIYLKADGTRDLTGNWKSGDNIKHIFGTGSDAEVYYDGTNFVIDVTAGNLSLETGVLKSLSESDYTLIGSEPTGVGVSANKDRLVVVKNPATTNQAMRAIQAALQWNETNNRTSPTYALNAFVTLNSSGGSTSTTLGGTSGGRYGVRLFPGFSGTIALASGATTNGVQSNSGAAGTVTKAIGFHIEAVLNNGTTTFGTVASFWCDHQVEGSNAYGGVMNGDGLGSEIVFGAGQDANIYYDGTNFVVDPKVVGSGFLDVQGDIQADKFNLATQETYTTTNVSTDRALNADSTSLDEVADVLGTLIADLKTAGLIQ